MKPERGSVVLVTLDPMVGHEQRGTRPCVVVSDADVAADRRFPMVAVIPVTSTPGEGASYPPLSPGPSGLKKKSYGMVDQLRAVDKRRVRTVFGRLQTTEIEAVDEGLRLFLGLG